MPLGSPDTLPEAIETAANVVSQGLEFVATQNGVAITDVLRRTSLERLFRVGASLAGRKPPHSVESVESEEEPSAEEIPENA